MPAKFNVKIIGSMVSSDHVRASTVVMKFKKRMISCRIWSVDFFFFILDMGPGPNIIFAFGIPLPAHIFGLIHNPVVPTQFGCVLTSRKFYGTDVLTNQDFNLSLKQQFDTVYDT